MMSIHRAIGFEAHNTQTATIFFFFIAKGIMFVKWVIVNCLERMKDEVLILYGVIVRSKCDIQVTGDISNV